MPVTALNTTTLSAAITASTNDFKVAATTNISVGDLLKVGNELMKVQEIPVSTQVRVLRGYAGTQAWAHVNARRVYIIADPEDTKLNFKNQLAMVGASGIYPDFLFPGQEADDGEGNRYIMVDATATMYGGATVSISNDGLYTAAVLVGGVQGRVGVLTEQVTSNQWAWAQVRGKVAYAQENGTSAATSAYIPIAESSLSTPPIGLLASSATTIEDYLIHGMWITGVAVSTGTSATTYTGTYVPLFIHDPYVMSYVEVLGDPTS
jgi:hypothetical protein